MNHFHVTVLSETEELFKGNVDAIFIPTLEGHIGILKNHASMISKLKPGNIRLLIGETEKQIPILGGFLNIDLDHVSIVVTSDL
jgi:F-type H+-transporting ATPase subunit epsilon